MGSAASACPEDVQDKVYGDLKEKYENEKSTKKGADISVELPGDLPACLELAPPDREKYDAVIYSKLERVYDESIKKHTAPVVTSVLKKLPDAIDTSLYVHDRWPLMVDPSGQAIRFLKYQRGSFLLMENPADTCPENLRKCLVGALQHGCMMVLNFDELEKVDLQKFFDEDNFPKEVLIKGELFKQETLKRILRPDKGDPELNQFLPKDDFKFVVVTKTAQNIKEAACEYGLCILNCLDPNANADEQEQATKQFDAGGAAIAEAFGAKEVKRNSVKMVEAGFDGEWDVINDQIEKGYYFDSTDAHGHTPLSEAACQGHDEIAQKLIDLGADPNSQNDTGRTPLFRASYNGHLSTVQLLLSKGGDPRLAAGMELPFDVAKTDEVREALDLDPETGNWNIEDTERLIKEREAERERQLESRLSTAAERDAYAREKIRKELCDLTIEGTCQELKERLEELADEAIQNNERPRGTAEVRHESGMTLLLLAVWKNKLETAEMLLTHWKTFDEDFDKIERRVFWSNIKAREAKGWNACALATFHGHKTMLELLLKEGCDPYVKNSYAKNSFDFAQDELDAARAVVTDRSEIRGVLDEWERMQHPAAAKLREEEEKEAQELAKAKDEKKKTGEKGSKGNGKKGGAKKGAAKKKGKKK